jgi:hypothetical protein
MPAVGLSSMFDIEDQDGDLFLVDFVEDSPVAGPGSPRSRVTYELCCLPRPGFSANRSITRPTCCLMARSSRANVLRASSRNKTL